MHIAAAAAISISVVSSNLSLKSDTAPVLKIEKSHINTAAICGMNANFGNANDKAKSTRETAYTV